MSDLIKEFEKKRRILLKNKRQYSTNSEKDRIWRIKKFLSFCESQGVERIKDINQSHYRQFVSDFLSSKSTETKRKYLYVLREFFQRAHLPIQVNVISNINRTKERKLNKILQILDIEITQEQKEEIFKII